MARCGAAGRTLAAAVLLLGGCASAWQERQHLVAVGMSEGEVESLLGPPSSRVQVPPQAGRPALLRWQWGDSLSTLATGAMFPDSIPPRVLAIGFDEDSKVEFIRPPLPPWPGSTPR